MRFCGVGPVDRRGAAAPRGAVVVAVAQLQDADHAAGSAAATSRGVVINGDLDVRTEGDDSFAAGVITGDVNIGRRPAPGTRTL